MHINLNTKLSFGTHKGLTPKQIIDKGKGDYFLWMKNACSHIIISKEIFSEHNKYKDKNSSKEKYLKKMWSDCYDFINKKGGSELLIEAKEVLMDYFKNS